MKSVIYSTTRMWNPGDEVIYRGVRNVMSQLLGAHNPILWNRNPGVKPFNQGFDNSLDVSRHLVENIRLMVSAGGPEWLGPRVAGLYQRVVEEKVDCLHLGIGLGAHKVSMTALEKEVLAKRSLFVSCRDNRTRDVLREIVPEEKLFVLPCPSLFSFVKDYEVHSSEQVKKVGINFQSAKMKFNNVSGSAYEDCLKSYLDITRNFDTTIICNYIDDYAEAVRIFDPERVRFSADIEDFLAFFREVDLVVGTRIHGCMGAIASGTPAIIMDSRNDARRRGVREIMEVLPAAPAESAKLLDEIGSINPKIVSKANREYQLEQLDRLLSLVGDVAPELVSRAGGVAQADSADWSDAMKRMNSVKSLRGRKVSERIVGGAQKLAGVVEKVERRWL